MVAKLDNGGNMQWAKSFGGSGNDYGVSIALDSSNFVYTVGQFQVQLTLTHLLILTQLYLMGL
ncbi:MAG: SBBP repeat-containing protein [Sphingobacteriaceae bacterium]|nr:SBBP repeat-containing protein [Sphingobacteriaceae bacterium]